MKFNEIDGIIFDKDGTLMEFQSFWLPVTYRVISKLCNEYELNAVIKKECINALGIDENDCIDPEGQLAIGTYATISTSLRNVLLRHEKSVQNSQLQKKITQWFEEESEKQTCHFTTDLKQLCDCLRLYADSRRGLYTLFIKRSNRHMRYKSSVRQKHIFARSFGGRCYK